MLRNGSYGAMAGGNGNGATERWKPGITVMDTSGYEEFRKLSLRLDIDVILLEALFTQQWLMYQMTTDILHEAAQSYFTFSG